MAAACPAVWAVWAAIFNKAPFVFKETAVSLAAVFFVDWQSCEL
jgi:hypothetical protein